MFLLSQIMDESRHLDVFRKRALANGGGLMQRPDITTSGVVGSIDLSREFTEMSSRLHISGEGAVLTLFRMGELMSYNEAEKRIYRLAAQDESRHVAFGVMHMRYLSETEPDRREEIHCYLDEGERGLLAGNQNPAAIDTPSSEAMAIPARRRHQPVRRRCAQADGDSPPTSARVCTAYPLRRLR